jgi:hypothetical protein
MFSLKAPSRARDIPVRAPIRVAIAIDQMMLLISAAGLLHQF